MNALQRTAAVINKAVRPVVESRCGHRVLGRWMTVITYTGRRSGRTFSLPVAYARRADELTISVELPDQKAWWRNFTGEGAELLVRLGGVDRPGWATAHRDADGKVTVTISLM